LKESIGHNTDIAVYHNWMCAIKLADGRIIVDDTVNKHLLMVVFAWGVLTIPLFGIGLISRFPSFFSGSRPSARV